MCLKRKPLTAVCRIRKSRVELWELVAGVGWRQEQRGEKGKEVRGQRTGSSVHRIGITENFDRNSIGSQG